MNIKKIIILIAAMIFSVSALVGFAVVQQACAGEETIILPPDPEEGEPTDPPADENPEPPEEPVVVPASVEMNPPIIHRWSRRPYVTVHIELPEDYSIMDIQQGSVFISELNERPVEPIYAVDRFHEIGDYDRDGTEDLMVKFSMNDIKDAMTAYGSVSVTVEGALSGGDTFSGSDSLRALDLRKWLEDVFRRRRGHGPGAEVAPERSFRYRLKEHIPGRAKILKAFIWISRDNYSKSYMNRLRYRGRGGNWLKFMCNRITRHFYLPVKGTQKGYEWDLTDTVKQEWGDGAADITVTMKYEETSGSTNYPKLVVIYDGDTAEGSAMEDQDLIAVAPKMEKPASGNIKLYYSRDKLDENVDEKELKIYGWDPLSGRWKPAASCVIDTDECSITTVDSRFSIYQIMRSAAEKSGNSDTASAAENIDGITAYPSPYNPAGGTMKFKNLTADIKIKIYTIAGVLVRELSETAGDGIIEWDGRNSAGEMVASGIYIVYAESEKDDSVFKVAVER